MQIVKETQKRTLALMPTCVVHEYDTQDGFISGAAAEIRGRYPEHGFVVNKKIKELAYVLSGHGHLITAEGKKEISSGDVIFIDHGEKFAWDGDITLFITTTPPFDPGQYVKVG